ncbi:hypothetical protein HG536_0B03520 [Torulaspora globosa]|uniref:J domain-containing protein n=1 Tax=Torulaspora globosa TaxID=48254 RepID=A0A7G3ZDA3_9SACH|nr:uncharacterized protein HG536_0B03520 [Torulaspora globosa]QLL31489.1 hypothetical protein HG536_0B03520 [Torulaspora globosa]
MSSSPDILLDLTTHYSILGLSSDATESDIHKSYMKLARLLHPDKSKSDASAEQFKLISHAHYVLMDKEQRSKYDKTLHTKGLWGYLPKGNFYRHARAAQKDGKHAKQAQKTQQAANHRQPYEQQPYGFGTENSRTAHPHPKVPIFQSFNLKNYQRKQRSAQERTPDEPNAPASFKMFTHRTSHEAPEDIVVNEPKDASSRSTEKAVDQGRTRSYAGEAEFTGNSNEDSRKKEEREEGEEELEVENLRWKMHKADTSYTSDGAPDSPFSDNQHRHYARKKHEATLRGRRSASPVKSIPTTDTPGMSESWSGLKNILNNFPSKEANIQHNNQKHAKEEKELLTSLRSSSLKARKGYGGNIGLEDLSSSLPPNDDFFDMHQVSDILDDVHTVKRTKRASFATESSDIEMKSPPKSQISRLQVKNSAYSSHTSRTLHMPVNEPLPKIYKKDIIAMDQYKINSQVAQLELPQMPIFQCNLLDSNEVEHCKRSVIEFNARCNALKQNLLAIMHDRLNADQALDERLVKIENAANWVSCKDFDFEVVNKLSELQNRQRIVAQSFLSLLKSLYATGH